MVSRVCLCWLVWSHVYVWYLLCNEKVESTKSLSLEDKLKLVALFVFVERNATLPLSNTWEKIRKIGQNEKDVKIDFILFNNQLGDIFSCEDKPSNATEADVQSDIEKAKNFREKRLLYIQLLFPHPSNIKYIEVISSQFHGLKLIVYCSKMTEEGTIIHYQKTKAQIPTAPSHMSQAAHFLLTVKSFQVSSVVAFSIDFDTYYLYLLLLTEGYCV